MANPEAAVWFVAEQREGELSAATAGLAAEARRIAQAMGSRTAAALLGDNVASLAGAIAADAVYVGEHPALAGYCPEATVAALAQAVEAWRPSVLLLAATPTGSDLAPRLAARLGTGLASGCLRLDADSEGVLTMLRPAYGGRASCTVACPSHRPQIATLLPESLPAGVGVGQCEPQVVPQVVPLELDLDRFRPRTAVERIERLPPSSLDVRQAEVVVAGGRGVGGPEGFRLLEELAGRLGGAVAASRPAVDAGWATASRQVGSSGRQVAPRLYIACGISGASQHVVGMRDAESVVAINPDPYCPMVSMADLALVGDVHGVLPRVLAGLRQESGAPSVEPLSAHSEITRREGSAAADVRRIAVCLSRSLDPEARFDARSPCDIAAAPRVLSTADRHALEEALALKNRLPGARVVALHAGPPEGEAVLRQALAMGADDAVLLWDEAFAGSDSLATARVLAAAVRRVEAGLVLCGNRGADGYSGQLPLQLGELLEAAAVSDVVGAEVGPEGRVTVRRRLEWGRQAVVGCWAPAVLALESETNRPRYPRLRETLRARTRPVSVWGLAELALADGDVGAAGSAIQVLKVGPPKPVAKGVLAAVEGLSAEERLQQLMGGAAHLARQSGQSPNVVRGSPDELADSLLRFLRERGFVREGGG